MRGVPCTTVARTLLDLAEVVDEAQLERAVEQAERLRVFDGRALAGVLARANGRRGRARLTAVLGAYSTGVVPQSALEQRFLSLCVAARIPEPETQARIDLPDGEMVFVDFLWAASRLIVETDGHETHGTRQAFERDRRRDRRLAVLGYRVVRFTWLDIEHRAEEVVRTISVLR